MACHTLGFSSAANQICQQILRPNPDDIDTNQFFTARFKRKKQEAIIKWLDLRDGQSFQSLFLRRSFARRSRHSLRSFNLNKLGAIEASLAHNPVKSSHLRIWPLGESTMTQTGFRKAGHALNGCLKVGLFSQSDPARYLNGLKTGTLKCAKSLSLRVATVRPCTRAQAAIMASSAALDE